MTGYYIVKTLHILFAVMFIGNILVSIFWKLYSDKSGDPKIMASTMRGIIKADRIFTMPGVIGLLVFGFAGQGIGGYSVTTPWILWSIVLYVISGAAFMVKVSPTQKKMLAAAEASNLEEYRKLSLDWNVWGIAATVTPLIAVVLMVFKPV